MGRLYVESSMPCLFFEASRGANGELLAFRCIAGNPAATECARGGERELHRWVETLTGLLELPACAHVVETGEPYTSELYFRSEEAEQWWLATAVQRGDGFALWLRDVSHERRADREVRQALERARAREERMEEEAEFRERFLGILGHDLRNPLSAISLSARALGHFGPLTPMQRDMSQRIETSAARMAKMIADILDLTRARRAGGIPLSLSPTSLSSVCRQVVEELTAAYPGRHITYEELGTSDGVWDAERLSQVVGNLVSNGLEHGGEDVPVFVRSYPCGELMALDVHNPGVPIPEHRLATLFEPFQPANASSGRKRRRGLGLGLYIVKELVEAHGGEVSVHSAENEGTIFTVLLPRDARPAVAERPAFENGEAPVDGR